MKTLIGYFTLIGAFLFFCAGTAHAALGQADAAKLTVDNDMTATVTESCTITNSGDATFSATYLVTGNSDSFFDSDDDIAAFGTISVQCNNPSGWTVTFKNPEIKSGDTTVQAKDLCRFEHDTQDGLNITWDFGAKSDHIKRLTGDSSGKVTADTADNATGEFALAVDTAGTCPTDGEPVLTAGVGQVANAATYNMHMDYATTFSNGYARDDANLIPEGVWRENIGLLLSDGS